MLNTTPKLKNKFALSRVCENVKSPTLILPFVVGRDTNNGLGRSTMGRADANSGGNT